MKKDFKLPTIFGILVLLSGLIAGIYMINSKQEFKLAANVEAIPRNVRFSNITNSGITISWTTEIESNGFIKWGNSENLINKTIIEENSNKSLVHTIRVADIPTNSYLYVKINSNGSEYDNDGVSWQNKTNSNRNASNGSFVASGNILLQDGRSPAKALVYLTIDGVTLSGITSDEGNFVIPVSNYIENVNENTAIEITVNSGSGTSQAIIYSKSLKGVPTMIIGKTYDFRSLTGSDTDALPKSSLSIPSSVEISSRFEVTKQENTEVNNIVTLDSIDNGEIITTTDPEFFGKGPKNTEIEIKVESELQEVALSTNSKGNWNWSPPNNLEPGEHKVTVSWKDTSGILRTLTRTFVVQASEGPAFEATPSASLSPSPSTSPSSTPKAIKTPIATAPPTPETGDIFPTIGLFMIGMGILFSSMYIWNKQDVY